MADLLTGQLFNSGVHAQSTVFVGLVRLILTTTTEYKTTTRQEKRVYGLGNELPNNTDVWWYFGVFNVFERNLRRNLQDMTADSTDANLHLHTMRVDCNVSENYPRLAKTHFFGLLVKYRNDGEC